ncbi:hypothetical protein Bca4012_031605 [Brassica carinata]
MVLPFHLPDIPIQFGSSDVPPLILSDLKFLTWMKCNAIYPDAQRYLYPDAQRYLYPKIRDWRPRRKTSTHGSVIPKCPDGLSELYYLHEMLHVTRGPCSYADLMTVNGFVYYTFKDAYMAFIFDNNH